MFRLYGATFSKVVWIAIVGAVIGNLPSFLMPGTPGEDPEAAAAAMGQLLWLLPLTMGGTIFCYAAIFYRMHGLAMGRETSLGDTLLVALRKFLPLIGASILYLLALMLGLVALVIPGIVLGITLYFYMPLIVLENAGIVPALKTSHRLVWGDWWRTATVLTVPVFIFIALYGVVGLMGGIAVGLGVASGGGGEAELESALETISMVSNLFIVLADGVLAPLFSALLLVQLHDLKLRRQGADLEARLAG